MRVGITGHRGLSAATEEAVRGEMQALLRQYEPAELCGVSCLADGLMRGSPRSCSYWEGVSKLWCRQRVTDPDFLTTTAPPMTVSSDGQ